MAQQVAEHPNAVRAREGYEAFSRGDLEAIKRLLHPNVVAHVSGRSPVSGDYKGVDGFIGWLTKLFELSDGTARVEVHDILADDTHVVVLSTGHAQRKGRSIAAQQIQVSHTNSQGQITESWFTGTDPYGVDEFWS